MKGDQFRILRACNLCEMGVSLTKTGRQRLKNDREGEESGSGRDWGEKENRPIVLIQSLFWLSEWTSAAFSIGCPSFCERAAAADESSEPVLLHVVSLCWSRLMVGRLHSCRTAACEIHMHQWRRFGGSGSQPATKSHKHLQQDKDLTSQATVGTLFAHIGTELKVWVEKYLACLLPGDCSYCKGGQIEIGFVWWECSMW